MVVQKEKINGRRSYIFVEWLFANERNKSMATLILFEWWFTEERLN